MVAQPIMIAWLLVSFPPAVHAPLLADSAESNVMSLEANVPSAHAAPVEERVKLKLVTPAIVSAAQELLTLPMGAEHYQTIGGKRYVFVLERHYHPPGFVGAPNGWHKGVTVYGVQ